MKDEKYYMYRAYDMKEQHWICGLHEKKSVCKTWITKTRGRNRYRQDKDESLNNPVRFVICKVEVQLNVQDQIEVYDPSKNIYELTDMAKALYGSRST